MVMVNTALAPEARVPPEGEHTTVPPDGVHPVETFERVSFAVGSVSVSFTPVAVSGPLLATVIV